VLLNFVDNVLVVSRKIDSDQVFGLGQNYTDCFGLFAFGAFQRSLSTISQSFNIYQKT
jgi:hypothetical protein